MADRVIFPPTGLAPEIPEDLYMLIKKVRILESSHRRSLSKRH